MKTTAENNSYTEKLVWLKQHIFCITLIFVAVMWGLENFQDILDMTAVIGNFNHHKCKA